MYDFSDAAPQREPGVVMPDGTFVKLRAKLRKGGASVQGFVPEDAGVFTASKDGNAFMLDFEFEVTHGPFARNKVFENWVVVGGTKMDEKGQSIAGNITKSRIRALLDSAQGLRSDDESEAAKAKRRIPSLSRLDGIPFVARLSIEAGGAAPNGGFYPDKNRIAKIITAEEPEWQVVFNGGEVPPKPNSSAARPAAASSGPAATPAWSQGDSGQQQLPGTGPAAGAAAGWADQGAGAGAAGAAWNGAAGGAAAPASAPAGGAAAGPSWVTT
jgi:hypothetical protein